MRLRLGYGDHNVEFEPLLPRDGMVERFVSSSDGNQWALFRPDAAIDYRGRIYDLLLLRSRWLGKEIGDTPPVPVFILLVDEPCAVADGFYEKAFVLVAWGTVEAL